MFFNKNSIAIGSHRGLTAESKSLDRQNTIAAFCDSKQQHATYIECDCIMTADHQLILFHDPVINKKPVIQQTLNELLSQQKHIELLSNLLKHSHPNANTALSPKGIYLELKYYETDIKRKRLFAKYVVDMLKHYHMIDHVIIVSFDIELLAFIYNNHTKISLGLNSSRKNKIYVSMFQKAIDHPFISQLNYSCPHIHDILDTTLPNIPKLIWEHRDETIIIKFLRNLHQKTSVFQWCINNNITGITTNTVDAVYTLLNEYPEFKEYTI